MVCIAVVTLNKLLGLSPFLAIVVGGAIGYAVARLTLRLTIAGVGGGGIDDSQSIIGARWLVMWAMSACAFRFLVGLTWTVSLVTVLVLVAFFVAVEQYTRAGDSHRSTEE
jgi:hypothetical protein